MKLHFIIRENDLSDEKKQELWQKLWEYKLEQLPIEDRPTEEGFGQESDVVRDINNALDKSWCELEVELS